VRSDPGTMHAGHLARVEEAVVIAVNLRWHVSAIFVACS
jgi:hypothetical protein